MRRFMLLAAMCAALVLAMAPAVMAQSRGPSGADGTYNCEDFDFQEDAQAFYNQDTSDPDGLDGPIGTEFTGEQGVACEELPSRGTGTGTTGTQYTQQPTATQYAPTTTTEAVDEVTPSTTTTTPLPDTGGPSLALLAGAFLAGTALFVGAGLVLRRR